MVSKILGNFQTAIFGHETWQLAKVPEVAHIMSFYPRVSKLSFFFRSVMGTSFRDTGWFQTCHIWAWNLAIGQSSRSCTYSLFPPQGEYKTGPVHTQQQLAVSDMTMSGWKLTISLFHPSIHPRGSKVSLFSLYGQWLLRFSKLPYLGMKLGHWQKDSEVTHIPYFYPSTPLSLFSLYGEWFLSYGPIFKLDIFGHETCQLAYLGPEVAHTLTFYPRGSKWSLFSRDAVSEILAYFQNCHIWPWNLAIGQVPEVAHILPKLPPES